MDFLEYELFDIAIEVYLLAFLSIIGGFVARKVITAVIDRLITASSGNRLAYDEIVLQALRKPAELGAVLAGVWGAAAILPLPDSHDAIDIARFVTAVLKCSSIALLIWFGVRLAEGLTQHWERLSEKTDSRLDDQIVPIVRSSTKVFLVIIGIILVLQNLGYSVTSLVAGLGIGGAALAFASKDTLSNLFGSIVIFLDRPFQIGDWIEMGDTEGVIEEVGLRTTRVRTFANSQITLPNALFTTNAINNWSRMAKRRISMTVGLTYDAKPEQIRAAVAAIENIIATDERFHHDFYLVRFDNFGASSLDIFIYCFTKTTNWAEFLTVKQDFLLAIMDAVAELGCDFAFPTQSLHIESLPGEPAALASQRPK